MIEFTFSTGGLVVAVTLGALWLVLRPRSVAARRLVLTTALVYLVASTYAVPALAARLMTFGYLPFSTSHSPQVATAIIVLGAGNTTVEGVDGRRLGELNTVGAARVLEAARVYRLTSADWVVSSGGASSVRDEPSAIVMRDALVRLGVPGSRIVVETESRNTREEVVRLAPMLRNLNPARVILVTSDVHMRRSTGAFRAQGIEVVPAIAPDPGYSRRWDEWFVPSHEGLRFTSEIVHELLGIPYYVARGWWRAPWSRISS